MNLNTEQTLGSRGSAGSGSARCGCVKPPSASVLGSQAASQAQQDKVWVRWSVEITPARKASMGNVGCGVRARCRLCCMVGRKAELALLSKRYKGKAPLDRFLVLPHLSQKPHCLRVPSRPSLRAAIPLQPPPNSNTTLIPFIP